MQLGNRRRGREDEFGMYLQRVGSVGLDPMALGGSH